MKSILLFILLFFSFSSFSQIVNIENQRFTAREEGIHGRAELNFNLTMNSKQFLQIGDKIQLGYSKKKHHVMLLVDHAFIKSEGDNFVNRGFEHIRYNYNFKDTGRVIFEAFQQSQFNKIQKINLRLILGTALRFQLVDQDKFQLSFGTGFMGEYEEMIDFGVSRDILSTSYLSADVELNSSIGFNTISYFQPKLINFGHYRFSNETSVRFKINKYLNFKIVYSLTHDSRNIPDVRKTNYVLNNTIQVVF